MTQATTLNYTPQQLQAIWAEAKSEARAASEKFFQERLGGRDQFACGFAWTSVLGIKGNTKLGRAIKAAGLSTKLWNPAGLGVQNVDTLYAGAEAAEAVFQRYGFKAFADSRLD